MMNVPQTLRFVAENYPVRWENLSDSERKVCLEKMGFAVGALTQRDRAAPELRQALTDLAAQAAPQTVRAVSLLKMADLVEHRASAPAAPVPPRTFGYLLDPEPFSGKGLWGPVRAGADDHQRCPTRGIRT